MISLESKENKINFSYIKYLAEMVELGFVWLQSSYSFHHDKKTLNFYSIV